jgi:hypothetical protein
MKGLQVGLVVGLLVAFVGIGVTQPKPRLKTPIKTIKATPLALNNQFQDVLKTHKVPTQAQAPALAKFRALPTDLQQDLLGIMDDKVAVQRNVPAVMLPQNKYKVVKVARPHLVLQRRITGFFPDKGTPNGWVYVYTLPRAGEGSQVLFDGATQTTHYLNFDFEFFPNTLAFQVPATTPLATDHDVSVQYAGVTEVVGPVSYRIVAPRGYRGYWGWKFSNFSDPTIPWACYRDFFGAAAVEYTNGSHRPAAQAWYDSTYKGIGGGGNCYGMSVSSLRERNDNIGGVHSAWFAGHTESYVWLYPWLAQTKETVQEYQGGQASAEMAAQINHYYNHQNHRQAWERVRDLVTTSDNRPVMGFWFAGGGGHATVPYQTEVVGDAHRIIMYDNNRPYAENETSGADPSVATVGWAANSFSYGTGNKMICMSYQECTQPQHLPAAATGGGGMGMMAAVFEGGAQVTQIQDAQGRRFFNADGSINTDAATRIPDSMKFEPLMGGPLPPGYPGIYLFNQSQGKDLSFTVAGAGQKMAKVFMQGDMMEVEFQGTGEIILNNILTPTRTFRIPNPSALRPTSIRCIKVLAVDRSFQLNNFANIGNQPLALLSKPDGSSLEVQSGGALQFNMQLSTFSRGQIMQGTFGNVELAANSKGTLRPMDWNNLPAGELSLELRNLQNNQKIRDAKIRPGG